MTKSQSDFILAGRRLGTVTTALGVGASDMSGWLLLALPGGIFLFGLHELWMPMGLVIGAFLNWHFIAKRLRVATEKYNDSLTLPSYLYYRFNCSTALRTISALTIIFFFTLYISSGFVAMAKLMHSLLHFDYLLSLIVCAVVVVTYSALGGFIAVNWIDVFQGLLMLFSLLLVPYVALHKMGGWHTLQFHFVDHGLFFHQINLTGLFLAGWGLGYFGQPHILARFMAIKDQHHVGRSKLICMSWMLLSMAGAVLIGVAGNAYFNGTLHDPEMIFVELSKLLLNSWFCGIIFAAVLSAIMSTIAAQIIASCSTISEDFFLPLFGDKMVWSKQHMVWLDRLIVILVSVVAFLLAVDSHISLLTLVGYAWAGFGAALGPLIIASLYFGLWINNSYSINDVRRKKIEQFY
ncbi:MAG: sodium/proline symporter [Gammaproteobacteria bacterium]|nr:sodium/proline symporter [Gammaproteobacteria bacterium]